MSEFTSLPGVDIHPTHYISDEKRRDDYNCPCRGRICDGFGHLFTNNQAARCPEWFRNPDVPDLAEYGSGKWKRNIFVDAAKQMLPHLLSKRKRLMLWLSGNGMGKTTVGRSMIFECQKRSIYPDYYTWPNIIEEIQKGFDGNMHRFDKSLVNRSFIVIDEVFRAVKEAQQKHEESLLQSVLATFEHRDDLSLLLISNMNSREFANSNGSNRYTNDRIKGHRMEMGKQNETVVFEGSFDEKDSYRGKP